MKGNRKENLERRLEQKQKKKLIDPEEEKVARNKFAIKCWHVKLM